MDSLACLPREILTREIIPWLDHNTVFVFARCCKLFAALSKEYVNAFQKFKRKIIERDANERTKVRTIFEWKHPIVIQTEPLEVLSMIARVSRQKYHVVLAFEIKLTPIYQRIFGHLILYCHRTRKHKREDDFWRLILRGDILTFETTPLPGGFLGRNDYNGLPRKIRTLVKKAVLWNLDPTGGSFLVTDVDMFTLNTRQFLPEIESSLDCASKGPYPADF